MSSFLSMPQDETLQGLALGKFDGMHLAHKALFAYLPPKSALLCIESKGEALTPYKESYSPYPILKILCNGMVHILWRYSKVNFLHYNV